LSSETTTDGFSVTIATADVLLSVDGSMIARGRRVGASRLGVGHLNVLQTLSDFVHGDIFSRIRVIETLLRVGSGGLDLRMKKRLLLALLLLLASLHDVHRGSLLVDRGGVAVGKELARVDGIALLRRGDFRALTAFVAS
jgi:hypothetical protein